MSQTWLCSMTITSPISASRMARAASCTEAVPGQRHGVGGHQLTNLLGHTLLLGLRPASRTLRCRAAMRVEPVRRRTALTDMVPHAARHLPVLRLTAAPVLL